MPAGVEQRQAGAIAGVERGQQEFGILAHAGLDHPPLAIDGIQLLGDIERAPGVVGDETLDAQ